MAATHVAAKFFNLRRNLKCLIELHKLIETKNEDNKGGEE